MSGGTRRMMARAFYVTASLPNGHKLLFAIGRTYATRPMANNALSKPANTSPEPMSPRRPWWKLALTVILTIAILTAGIVGMVKVTVAWASVALFMVATAFVLLVLNFDHVRGSKMKAGSVEVEWPALREEASVTMEQVRALALVVAKMSLELLAHNTQVAENMRLKKELEQALVILGISGEKLREVTSSYRDFIAMMHIRRIVFSIRLQELPEECEYRRWSSRENYEALIADFMNPETGFRMPPAEIRKRLRAKYAISGRVEESLIDYEYFAANDDLRRPDAWSDRES